MESKKYDNGKPMWHLLPLDIVEQIVEVLNYGLEKYQEKDSWQKIGDAKNRYFSAALRHLTKWQSGEIIDIESMKTHLAHCATNIIFLMWLEKNESKFAKDKN